MSCSVMELPALQKNNKCVCAVFFCVYGPSCLHGEHYTNGVRQTDTIALNLVISQNAVVDKIHLNFVTVL